MIYIDSSVLLEIYLSQPRAAEARALLAQGTPKVSSWLLVIEVSIVLRRALAHARDNHKLKWLLQRFDEDIRGISLFNGIHEVAQLVRLDRRYAGCRALDALHAGTALQAQEMSGHPVQLATFDTHLADLAQKLGLGTCSPPPPSR